MTKYCLLGMMVFGAFLAGCASVKSHVARDANLNEMRTFYVRKLPADERGVEEMIVQQLKHMGYAATAGTDMHPDEPVDAIVTYEDRWTWDVTMYLFELKVSILDSAGKNLMAEGVSRRPTLQRKQPEEMVKEVLEKVLGPVSAE